MIDTNPSIYQESIQESTRMLHEADDEADETLSLCDLEIYNDATTSQELSSSSSSSPSSSSSSLEQDLFAFFSEEYWSSSTPSDNIMFCGKIIPSKRPISPIKQMKLPNKSRGLFRWNSEKRASESNTITSTPPRSKSTPVSGKYGNNIAPKRMSIFNQSPTKSRWFLFLFGMAGFPRKMELSDIRSRQLRRSSSTMFRVEGSGDEEEVVVGGSGRRMGLIKALGCGGGNQTKSVGGKAAVGCFGGV